MASACTRALGKRWPWLPGLCRRLQQRTSGALHDWSRSELAELIDADAAFDRAWENPDRQPHIVAPPLDSAPPSTRPDWLPHHLPRWRTPAQLAEWLGLSPEELEGFTRSLRDPSEEASHRGHYAYRWMEKRHGGVRLIESPKSRLREAQRRLLHGFLEHVPVHQAAHGYVLQRSTLTHARQHAGRAAVLRFDLADFFSSVAASRVHALFATLGCPEAVARRLTALCTHRTSRYAFEHADAPFRQRQLLAMPHLPQGAPTSPALANLCAFRLDLRLAALAAAMDATYTRYADDLVFSGGDGLRRGTATFEAHVGAIASEEGFALNFRKTRCMGSATRQTVTGLVVNRFANIPRAEYDEIKAILHNCAAHGAATQNRAGVADFRAHLQGRVAYVAAVHPARGARLKRLFELIAWVD